MSEQGAQRRSTDHAAGGRRHADRAAQFMPFAALTGYYDLIRAVAERQARAEAEGRGPGPEPPGAP